MKAVRVVPDISRAVLFALAVCFAGGVGAHDAEYSHEHVSEHVAKPSGWKDADDEPFWDVEFMGKKFWLFGPMVVRAQASARSGYSHVDSMAEYFGARQRAKQLCREAGSVNWRRLDYPEREEIIAGRSKYGGSPRGRVIEWTYHCPD